ncbi:5-formyltetrahydrofolate cyclo-ligase [Rhizobium sp. KVB221]|uniref:5-formyltetrahydrofolate cyclo-ligase n=1 Tax=Rhizobium setariae TaxID=2801340 RepID=A0A936YQ23_9HYPH|nr:5-formyltetrahydrofolate cyclo-ligase [Rhizobium setariae]MBL0374623.1 5-formyltetrahydrofolate cyclo-ligase [Rhizobium setariae]
MDAKINKLQLRKARLAARDEIPVGDRIEKSLLMADLASEIIAFEPGEVISGFFPIKTEADIRPLMHRLKGRGARLCLPVVLDRHTIEFREIADGMPMVDTGFGTSGPGSAAPVLDPDVLLVPLSAFDATGHRIGYGAGYYDRAIAKLYAKGRSPRLIGIAFDCQQVETIPFEAHDVPLDAVLTESGLHMFQKDK